MNRALSILNFLGIAALAVLCAVQWQANSHLLSNVDQLQHITQDQAAQISDQTITLKQNAEDLTDLRDRLATSESDLAAATGQIAKLKSSLDQWMQAVKDRDAALKNAGVLVQSFAAQRNDAIKRFNDLADKYNALVKQVQNGQ
jgi:chromosome segregation ATPase